MTRSVLVLGTAVLVLIAVVVVSPWLIRPIVGQSGDWRELSDLGQAYGGISAILSGLAFCGITVSLLLQWRQVRLTQLLITRERHFELVKLGLEDSSLPIPVAYGSTHDEIRKTAYSNLWVAHWVLLWDTGAIGSVEARHLFDTLFRDETAVAWWAAVGSAWNTQPGRRRRTLMAIVDEAHRAAVDVRRSRPDTGDDPGVAGARSAPGSAVEGQI